MSELRDGARVLMAGVIVIAFVVLVAVLVNEFGGFDIARAQWAARAAEARAAELQAQADLLANRRELWATGALVFASVKDSILVTIAFLCNGALALGLGLGALWERIRQAREV